MLGFSYNAVLILDTAYISFFDCILLLVEKSETDVVYHNAHFVRINLIHLAVNATHMIFIRFFIKIFSKHVRHITFPIKPILQFLSKRSNIYTPFAFDKVFIFSLKPQNTSSNSSVPSRRKYVFDVFLPLVRLE